MLLWLLPLFSLPVSISVMTMFMKPLLKSRTDWCILKSSASCSRFIGMAAQWLTSSSALFSLPLSPVQHKHKFIHLLILRIIALFPSPPTQPIFCQGQQQQLCVAVSYHILMERGNQNDGKLLQPMFQLSSIYHGGWWRGQHLKSCEPWIFCPVLAGAKLPHDRKHFYHALALLQLKWPCWSVPILYCWIHRHFFSLKRSCSWGTYKKLRHDND